ncbi:MAG: TetR/AcrR family transcriptional regulator [Anaerolineae bacterium]|nr:TetR/AcrR family transcriptional regulator [Anaerolineae bacterium]
MSTVRELYHSNRTYRDLINAAMHLIVERGYDAVSVTDITRAADYGRSTFYIYFENKEAMLWALLEHHLHTMDAAIVQAVQHLPQRERIFRAWVMIFRDIVQQRPFFLQLDSRLTDRLRLWQKQVLIDNLTRQLDEGLYSLELEVAPNIGARFIVGGLLEILEDWLQHPERGTPEEMASQMYYLVFREKPCFSTDF